MQHTCTQPRHTAIQSMASQGNPHKRKYHCGHRLQREYCHNPQSPVMHHPKFGRRSAVRVRFRHILEKRADARQTELGNSEDWPPRTMGRSRSSQKAVWLTICCEMLIPKKRSKPCPHEGQRWTQDFLGFMRVHIGDIHFSLIYLHPDCVVSSVQVAFSFDFFRA